MTDGYMKFVRSTAGSKIANVLGLSVPAVLDRYDGHEAHGVVGIFGCAASPVYQSLKIFLQHSPYSYQEFDSEGIAAKSTDQNRCFHALIMDASECETVEQLDGLYRFFGENLRALGKNSRVIVLGRARANEQSYSLQVTQRALPGFVRSLAKELRSGATAQLVNIENHAEKHLNSTLEFFLSPKSAFVNAQCIRLSNASPSPTLPLSRSKPLTGKVALVTGASRGIGLAIAQTLQRDGARVICLDVPAVESQLNDVAKSIDGLALALDICSDDATEQIIRFVSLQTGHLDLLVHNAGITRDKSLAAMSECSWQRTLAVNLASPMRINAGVLGAGIMPEGGRIVGVSSISGIAGNKGQTNYATSKAGVIGMIEAGHLLTPSRGITFNCVAPGFIETEMTAKLPFFIRQAGRRMSSLNQAGLPVDVAETIAWLCHPESQGVQGNTVRVCGQNLLGC